MNQSEGQRTLDVVQIEAERPDRVFGGCVGRRRMNTSC